MNELYTIMNQNQQNIELEKTPPPPPQREWARYFFILS